MKRYRIDWMTSIGCNWQELTTCWTLRGAMKKCGKEIGNFYSCRVYRIFNIKKNKTEFVFTKIPNFIDMKNQEIYPQIMKSLRREINMGIRNVL